MKVSSSPPIKQIARTSVPTSTKLQQPQQPQRRREQQRRGCLTTPAPWRAA